MATTYQTETLAEVRDEIGPLLEQHYREVALYQDEVPLAPDWGRYEHLEKIGGLKIYTARRDGELVGYAVFLFDYHLHYVTTLIARNDIVFLRKDCRGVVGYRLIEYAHEQLKKLSPVRVCWHVKFSNDFSPLLHRLGYVDEEKIVGAML